MSRFFASGNSDSDESSSEDEEEKSSEEEEAEEVAPAAAAKPTLGKGAAAFMKGDDDSDSDDDKKRVVKSNRDKKWEQMQDMVNDLKNHVKINDWLAISDDFEKLNKLLAKSSMIVAKEGVPAFYFKGLLFLEKELNKALDNKEAKKKMSSTNAKALNGMKQKLRKHMKNYEKEIEDIKKSGGGGGDDDSDDMDDGSDSDDSDAPAKPTKKKPEPAAAAAPPKPPGGPKEIKDYNEADIDKKLDEILALRGRKGTKKDEQILILEQLADVTKRPSKLVELLGHMIAFSFDIHISMLMPMPVKVWKQIFDVFARILQTLKDNPDLKVITIEGSTVVDTVQMTVAEMGEEEDEFIDSGVTQMTGNVLSYLERLDDEFYKSLQLADPHSPDYVARLKDEVPLVNLMQDTLAYYDSKGGDDRKDAEGDAARVGSRIVEHIYYREQSLFDTATNNAEKRKVQLSEASTAAAAAAKVAETEAVAEEEALAEEEEEEDDDDDSDDDGEKPPKPETEKRKAANAAAAAAKEAAQAASDFLVPRAMVIMTEMQALATRIYAFGTDRAKTRTLLCHVYHHALHGRYSTARDMLLMSHLPDTIHQSDISTQILYNRALVRLGLCAFCNRMVHEAHSALMEIAAGTRLKESLAQAVSSSRYADRNPEQERLERRRLVPYHMHINLELVEAVHLVCAMLLELPHLAHNAFDPKRRSSAVSKAFRRLLDHFERQVFNGPPENSRDYVMSAAQLLLVGKWKEASDHLTSMTVWDLLPDPQGTRDFIGRQLRSEGLRAYLISSYAHYDSISLEKISSRFGLDENLAHAAISKMLLDSEVHACWDQPTSTVVVQRMEPSKLQFLALQFADKCAQLVEANERILDSRTGSYGYKFDERRDQQRESRNTLPEGWQRLWWSPCRS